VPPVVDTVLAGWMALTLLIAIPRCANPDAYNQTGEMAEGCGLDGKVGLGLAGVVGLVTAISAVHGFRATKSCRHRRELERTARVGIN